MTFWARFSGLPRTYSLPCELSFYFENNTSKYSWQFWIQMILTTTAANLRDGLIFHQLFCKETVESEEICQLTCRVNFSLKIQKIRNWNYMFIPWYWFKDTFSCIFYSFTWIIVLDWPSMVVAFISALYSFEIISATFRNNLIFSSIGTFSQSAFGSDWTQLSWIFSGLWLVCF